MLHREDVGDSANARAHPTPASFEEYSRDGCTVTGCGLAVPRLLTDYVARIEEGATIPPVNRACFVIRVENLQSSSFKIESR